MYNHLFTVHSDVISYLFIIQCLAFISHLLFVAFPTALWSRLLIVCFLLRLRASRHIVFKQKEVRACLVKQKEVRACLVKQKEVRGLAPHSMHTSLPSCWPAPPTFRSLIAHCYLRSVWYSAAVESCLHIVNTEFLDSNILTGNDYDVFYVISFYCRTVLYFPFIIVDV